MENASKALIIAGAILISILLISVAIMVMNSTSGVTDQVEGNMDAMAVQQFNAKFDVYAGKNQGASTVKSLLSAIMVNNAQSDRKVGVTIAKAVSGHTADLSNSQDKSAISAVVSALSSTKKYNITIGTDNNGYDNLVTITKGN